MKPIERVQTRAWALELLGVSAGADAETIRAAWRRATFERHPDRNGGDQSRFIQAKTAYDFLCNDEGMAFSAQSMARRAHTAPRASAAGAAPERPRPAARVEPLPADVISACEALLAAPRKALPSHGPAATMRLHPDAPFGPGVPTADHVVRAVQRKGRELTYLVSGALAHGVNRVALPTALLAGTRNLRPEVIAISATHPGKGTVTLPDAVRTRLFPGARSVRLRFGLAVEALSPHRADVEA